MKPLLSEQPAVIRLLSHCCDKRQLNDAPRAVPNQRRLLLRRSRYCRLNAALSRLATSSLVFCIVILENAFIVVGVYYAF